MKGIFYVLWLLISECQLLRFRYSNYTQRMYVNTLYKVVELFNQTTRVFVQPYRPHDQRVMLNLQAINSSIRTLIELRGVRPCDIWQP